MSGLLTRVDAAFTGKVFDRFLATPEGERYRVAPLLTGSPFLPDLLRKNVDRIKNNDDAGDLLTSGCDLAPDELEALAKASRLVTGSATSTASPTGSASCGGVR